MKKRTLLLVCVLLNLIQSIGQVEPLPVQVRNNEFLKKIINSDAYIYPMVCEPNLFIKTNEFPLRGRHQSIIKTPKNLYVQSWGSGFLFKMTSQNDSILTFSRIDKTENLNYKLGAYHFNIGEDIYNFGGYGFWKNNGLLSKYNFHLEEWGIYPVTEEVIPQLGPVNPTWLDTKEQKLYLPFQLVINAGLADRAYIQGKVQKTAKILDIKTGVWENIGEITGKSLEIMRNGVLKFSCERGLVIIWNEELYLIDYLTNAIYKLEDKAIAHYVLQLQQTDIVYHNNNVLYRLNLSNYNSDSIMLDLNKFTKTSIKIVENKYLAYLEFFLGVVILLVFLFMILKKIRPKKRADAQKIFKQNNLAISFTDVEKTIITLLINHAANNQTVTVDEINYLAGVKNKTVGLQKKIRNDVLNNINEKYKLLTQNDEELIERKRSGVDKRYFEYFITEEKINKLKRIFNASTNTDL